MQEIKDNEVHWFVIGSLSLHKELKIRDNMRMEGIECYVPMRYEVKTVRRQQQRTLEPAITGVIFAKSTLATLKDYILKSKEHIYLRKSTFSNKQEYLIVGDKEMDNFIRATELSQENVTYFNPSEVTLHEGDKIRVKGGLYDGIEGILTRIKGKKRKSLVVQIPGVAIAAIEMTPDMVELRDSKVPENQRIDRRSINLEEDTKKLYEVAFRLLFIITDKYQNENEYYIALSDMKRLKERIQSYKGWTAQSEGELALALYMANVKLDTDIEASEERLRKAIEKIQSTSMLRLKMQLILARLSGDKALEEKVMETVKSWPSKLTRGQEMVMEVVKKLKIEN